MRGLWRVFDVEVEDVEEPALYSTDGPAAA